MLTENILGERVLADGAKAEPVRGGARACPRGIGQAISDRLKRSVLHRALPHIWSISPIIRRASGLSREGKGGCGWDDRQGSQSGKTARRSQSDIAQKHF
jgi:hypothetical protein